MTIYKLILVLFTALCWLNACSGSAVKAVSVSAGEIDDVARAQEASEDVMARLAMLNSLEDPKKQAEEIYMLSLENFIENEKSDRRIPKMIMWRGNYYFQRAIYPKAIQSYNKIILKYPDTPFFIEAMKMIARAYARNGEFEIAEVWYRRLRNSGNDSLKRETRSNLAGIMYRNGRQYERKGAFNKAGATYFKIVGEFPNVDIAARALIDAGRMKEKLKNWKGAIKIYQLFLKRYYESSHVPQALFREAVCWEKRQAYKKSAKKHLSLVRSFPASREARQSLLLAGSNFEKSGELTIAARIYERYVQLYPKQADVCQILLKALNLFQKLELRNNVEKNQIQFNSQCDAS